MNSTPPQNFSTEAESTIIQKQRRELQLLIAELKDRDQELNEMVAVHQRQFLAWEDDRQKTLTLGERCGRLENELHKRNEMITTLTRRLKVLESQQSDRKLTLESTQQKLQELSRKASDTSLHCQALEEKNQALSYSVIELSNRVGQLQAREQELLTMLKLKDNDILEATNHITEFTCKYKKLESSLRAARMEELNVNKEKQNFKLRLKEVMLETNKLKGDLSEKTKENSEQREEIIQLKQENTYLSNELMLSAERASRRDQLLLSARSKQLRTDTELNNLRQIYVKQQRDLQFLHINLESSQEAKEKPKSEPQEGSRGMVLSDLEGSSDGDSACSKASLPVPARFVGLPTCSLKNACPAEGKQLAGPADKQLANLGRAPEGPFDSPRSLPREELRRSSPRRAGEAEKGSAARLEPPWKMEGRETAWAPEGGTVLPIHEHWRGLKPCAGTVNGLPSRFFDKSSGDCKEAAISAARTGCWTSCSRPARPGNALEGGCHPCSAVSRAARNQERVPIFKPVEEGSPRCSEFSKGPQAAGTTLKSDRRVSLNVFDWGSPCLTSTQKSNGCKTPERPPGTEAPSDLQAPGRGYPSIHHDKLQRLLAESRKMVAELERSTLLGASLSDSLHPATVGPESFCEGRLPTVEGAQMTLSRFSL